MTSHNHEHNRTFNKLPRINKKQAVAPYPEYPALALRVLDKRTRAVPLLGPVLSGLTPTLGGAYVTDGQGSTYQKRAIWNLK